MHESLMRRALALAEMGAGTARPNPLVGAVIARDGMVVGEGYHVRAGAAHAEIAALERAGPQARGADLYVNLEPCAHYGRTPPCVDAILLAGVARVFVGCRDPNPLVDGRGIAALRAGGVEVVEKVLEDEARLLNDVFFHWVRHRTPFVVLKLAQTLDGRIATRTGASRWITGKAARRRVHQMRRRYGAVLVGTNTLRFDDPVLTVREVDGPQPVRFALDPWGQTSPDARILSQDAPTVIVMGPEAPSASVDALRAKGAEVWRLPASEGEIDLEAFLLRAAEQGVDALLVEGGGEIAWSFLSRGLVHKLVLFVAPRVFGGREAIPSVGGEGVSLPGEAIEVRNLRVEWVDEDLLLMGYLGGCDGCG